MIYAYQHKISSNFINGFDLIDSEMRIVAVDVHCVLLFMMTCTGNMADRNFMNFVDSGCIGAYFTSAALLFILSHVTECSKYFAVCSAL